MGQYLNLTTDQVKQLTKLRDDYIEKYATTEEQLKVANEDLGRALYGDSVDMNAPRVGSRACGRSLSKIRSTISGVMGSI